jgi:hypothetical protein
MHPATLAACAFLAGLSGLILFVAGFAFKFLVWKLTG